MDSSTDAFLSPSSPTQRDAVIHGKDDWAHPSSCEFWCTSRLTQSRLNKQSLPLAKVLEPWAPVHERGGGLDDADQSPTRVSQSRRAHRRNSQKNDLTIDGPETPKKMLPRIQGPSDYLIDTIQNRALSSTNPDDSNWTFSGKSRTPLRAPLTWHQRRALQRTQETSLQKITADYIDLVEPALRGRNNATFYDPSLPALEPDYNLQSMLCGNYIDYLAARQYNFTDVMAWAWVLTSNTTYEATLRIYFLEADWGDKATASRPSVPTFIPLLLLLQEIDLKTFRLLLVYCLHIVAGRPVPHLDHSFHSISNHAISKHLHNLTHTKSIPSVDHSTCAKFVVRLLSHARRLWPEAQLPIAQAFAFHLRTTKSKGTSFVTKKLNKFIRLLSLPSGPRPFVTASIQQQAQFELLKAVADKYTVSPITRRGYQGLASVQLAHKKTAAERESAELKTPSWPPWKEERSGIDSDKGMEGMRSRAIRVISQMREAGYPYSLWEEVSGIYAGWDTDNSPTIQTRTLARPPEHLRGKSGNQGHHAIWEARIRATRTVREAWACFTAYESWGHTPHASVYVAMGEKLVFETKAAREKSDQPRFSLPGDGPEVFPEPASARDWIYTPTEPPTLSAFLKTMLSQGFRPSGRFLALLLHNAPAFHVGLDCLNCSDLTNQQLRVLFSFGDEIPDNDAEAQRALDELPEYIVSAFIRFLCRFSVVTRQSPRIDNITTADAFPIITNNWPASPSDIPTLFAYTDKHRHRRKGWYSKLLSHAIRLLQKRNSSNPQGWVQLLAGLRSTRILGGSSNINRHTQMVLAWHEILVALNWLDERNIEIGPEGFQILCTSFSKAMVAGVKDQKSTEKGLGILATAAQGNVLHPELVPLSFEDMVEHGLETLKSQFDRLVLLDPKTSPIFESFRLSLEGQTESQVSVPTLAHAPSPPVLHAFVRSLGLAEDSEGLLNLLRWMSQHSLALKQMSDEYSNGSIMMRRTIVAVRMFLEGYWGRRPLAPAQYQSGFTDHAIPSEFNRPTFSDPTLQEAYDIIATTELWGPWPSDEEVWDYLAHMDQ